MAFELSRSTWRYHDGDSFSKVVIDRLIRQLEELEKENDVRRAMHTGMSVGQARRVVASITGNPCEEESFVKDYDEIVESIVEWWRSDND